MTYDVMLFSLRKLYKQYEECDWMNPENIPECGIRHVSWEDLIIEFDERDAAVEGE